MIGQHHVLPVLWLVNLTDTVLDQQNIRFLLIVPFYGVMQMWLYQQ
jgi:hypothetical protein